MTTMLLVMLISAIWFVVLLVFFVVLDRDLGTVTGIQRSAHEKGVYEHDPVHEEEE